MEENHMTLDLRPNRHLDRLALDALLGAAVDAAIRPWRSPPSPAAAVADALERHAVPARLLLEAGAAVDAKNEQGTTPLMLACMTGHVEAARLLLEKGADRSLPSPTGHTVLEDLDMFGHPEEKKAALRALLSTGAMQDAC